MKKILLIALLSIFATSAFAGGDPGELLSSCKETDPGMVKMQKKLENVFGLVESMSEKGSQMDMMTAMLLMMALSDKDVNQLNASRSAGSLTKKNFKALLVNKIEKIQKAADDQNEEKFSALQNAMKTNQKLGTKVCSGEVDVIEMYWTAALEPQKLRSFLNSHDLLSEFEPQVKGIEDGLAAKKPKSSNGSTSQADDAAPAVVQSAQ